MEGIEKHIYVHGWRLTRRETKAVKNMLRATGDAGAAEKLLRHSIAYGHNRLVVRRYLLARELGLASLDVYERYFIAAKQELTAEELEAAKQDVARRAGVLLTRDMSARRGEEGLAPLISSASGLSLARCDDTNL